MVERIKTSELIPAAVHAFAREFTALASKHGLRSGSIQLSFGYRAEVWDQPITIVWEEGRHGEDARRYHIETTLRVRDEVKAEPWAPPITGGNSHG